MLSKDGDVTEEDEVDVDAQARLQIVTLGMKQQADELLMAGELDKALTLYRELLMHLTRSQVTLLQQRELVVSCRMNVLAALSKAKRWSSVVTEAEETLAVFAELERAEQPQLTTKEEQERQNQVLARAYYFRGFAYLKLGSLQPSQQDFHRAMELNPEDETIQTDYKELRTALQAEHTVKQLLATSMKLYQSGKYQSAVEACLSALRESQLLQKTELTGLIHGNLAAIYVKMRDDAKAIAHYKRTMLLTRCGGEPTAAQNERVFDILDSLAGCYARKRDYSSALSVIEDQVKLFPLCPERKDREALMHLNCGRICFNVGRYPEAQEHLEKGCSVANTALNQLDVALNCAFWLSKAYAQNSNAEQAMATLDGAISNAEKEVNTASIAELLDKLLMARVDLLDPDTEINAAATEISAFKDPVRESQLWRTVDYFQGRRQISNCVRTAEVLFRFLQVKEDAGTDEGRSEMMRAVALVDFVNIRKLSTSEATRFMNLALAKVDLLLANTPTNRREAKQLLVKLLQDLELPGGADPSCRQQLRGVALLRLADVCSREEGDESDDDVREFLEEACDFLRSSDSASDARLLLLPRIGQWRAARGDIVGAEEVLEENVELLRGSSKEGCDRLYESLVGLCVLRIRLGNFEEATRVMEEIEGLPIAERANELSIITERLQAAKLMSEKEKEKKAKEVEKANLLETQHSSEGHFVLCGISRVWWGRWCGPVIACVAAAAVFLVFA